MEDHETLQYLFDLQGYVVLKDVLSAAEVGELNRLLDGQGLSRPGLKTEEPASAAAAAAPRRPA